MSRFGVARACGLDCEMIVGRVERAVPGHLHPGVLEMQTRSWPVAVAAGLTAIVGFATLAVAATGDLPQTAILTTPAFESDASASGSDLTWDQSPNAFVPATKVYLRHGGVVVRINQTGTSGGAGGIDGNRVIYQQIKHGQSNLMLFDSTTKAHTNPPAGFNTRLWEYAPSISGNWVLFGRLSEPRLRREQVILRNLTSGKQVTLDSMTNGDGFQTFNAPGQVNGNWASWVRCANHACRVLRYDIASGRHKAVNIQVRQLAYAPSVGADGTVYFAVGKTGCGNAVQLIARPVGRPPTVLVHFKSGYDVFSTSATADPTSGTDVYFTKIKCRGNKGDIFRVTAP